MKDRKTRWSFYDEYEKANKQGGLSELDKRDALNALRSSDTDTAYQKRAKKLFESSQKFVSSGFPHIFSDKLHPRHTHVFGETGEIVIKDFFKN